MYLEDKKGGEDSEIGFVGRRLTDSLKQRNLQVDKIVLICDCCVGISAIVLLFWICVACCVKSNINYSPSDKGCRDRRIPTSCSISLQGRRSWGDDIPLGQQWSLTNASRDALWAFRGNRKEEGVVLFRNWTLKGHHLSSEHRSVHISEASFYPPMLFCCCFNSLGCWLLSFFGFVLSLDKKAFMYLEDKGGGFRDCFC
ncbi:hypothetical protein CEXT_194851 [Caerostris extrusa]|uniref:Uncharacterized protein n=1 Tax=Caerostris extrusa TaxID=172846 RepID=A0AAV4W2Z6_CAEEX|nr:hypothetical protein CEXT_194851 [Caerostris extrusa]